MDASGLIPAPALLDGEAARDPGRAGGKAAALARAAGLAPAPAFLVLAPHAFTEAGLDPDALAALRARLPGLGPGPFAVRSSGLEEDGVHAAHAGQFETLLNVAAADVPGAAERVWRSGFSESLAAYRRAHGLSDAPQPPAVMVQVMVRARAAGVAFSTCPVTGDAGIAVVNAVAGLGDRLVAGEVDGDCYRVGVLGDALETIAEGETPVLTAQEAAAVAALARAAAAHFGAPQDVEWAFEGERLLLLQSRPITTLPVPALADPAVTIWDNSNIVESYPGIVSPLTFSFARGIYDHVYRAFSKLMGVSDAAIATHGATFANLLGRVEGRVYYNLLNWYRALALFPGFKANRAFMEQMMGVAEALPTEVAEAIAPPTTDPWAKRLDQLRLLRVGFGLIWQGLRLRGTIAAFQARLDEALARPDAEIEALPPSALAAEYRDLESRLLERWDAPLINDFLCMIAFGASRRAFETWGGADGLALHADALIGQGDIISAQPARRIREMGEIAKGDAAALTALAYGDLEKLGQFPALSAAMEAYLDRFGDRCTEELKLESLPLREDPSALLQAVAAAARAGAPPRPAAHDVEARLTALFKGKPLKRALAAWLLSWARARVRDRENLRFQRTRLFGRVRRIVRAIGARLAAGGVLGAPRDVFHLTIEETLGAVEGGAASADLKALVSARRAEEARDRARPDPPERFETRGAFLLGLPRRVTAEPPAAESGATRKGLACCAGVVEARVRVIDDPRTQALEPGEILVARHTDPGWIAVFANASGVIAERGSLLSHSAIVAREMGVPCVVGLKGAASWLQTGDQVRLDGGTGLVERLAHG